MAELKNVNEEWTNVQEKTFRNWCNSKLKHHHNYTAKIPHLSEAFHDGLNLIRLLEILSETPLPYEYFKRPRYELHSQENISLCFKFLREQKVRTVNVDFNDIYGGNLKLILGLVWSIIKSYDILGDGVSQTDKELSKNLLKWVNGVLEGYDLKLKNFRNWGDGRALKALIHSLKREGPAGFYPQKDLDAETIVDNAMLDGEENHFIPKLMDARDLLDGVDLISTITLVAMIKNEYEGGPEKRLAKKRKIPVAAKSAFSISKTDKNVTSLSIELKNFEEGVLPGFKDSNSIEIVAEHHPEKHDENPSALLYDIISLDDGKFSAAILTDLPGTYEFKAFYKGEQIGQAISMSTERVNAKMVSPKKAFCAHVSSFFRLEVDGEKRYPPEALSLTNKSVFAGDKSKSFLGEGLNDEELAAREKTNSVLVPNLEVLGVTPLEEENGFLVEFIGKIAGEYHFKGEINGQRLQNDLAVFIEEPNYVLEESAENNWAVGEIQKFAVKIMTSEGKEISGFGPSFSVKPKSTQKDETKVDLEEEKIEVKDGNLSKENEIAEEKGQKETENAQKQTNEDKNEQNETENTTKEDKSEQKETENTTKEDKNEQKETENAQKQTNEDKNEQKETENTQKQTNEDKSEQTENASKPPQNDEENLKEPQNDEKDMSRSGSDPQKRDYGPSDLKDDKTAIDAGEEAPQEKTAVEGGEGNYELTWVPSKPGAFTISVRVNKLNLQLLKKTVCVKYMASAEKSHFQNLSEKDKIFEGLTKTRLKLDLCTNAGAPFPADFDASLVDVHFTLAHDRSSAGAQGDLEIEKSVRAMPGKAPGEFLCEFFTNKAGAYDVFATLDGERINLEPLVVEVQKRPLWAIEGAFESGQCGEPQMVAVHHKDRKGHLVPSEDEIKCVVAPSNGELVELRGEGDDCQKTFVWRCDDAGTFDVSLLINGSNLFVYENVVVRYPVKPDNSLLECKNKATLQIGQPIRFRVTLKDGEGNHVGEKNLEEHLFAGIRKAKINDTDDMMDYERLPVCYKEKGIFEFEFSSDEYAEFFVKAQYYGKEIKESPLQVNILPKEDAKGKLSSEKLLALNDDRIFLRYFNVFAKKGSSVVKFRYKKSFFISQKSKSVLKLLKVDTPDVTLSYNKFACKMINVSRIFKGKRTEVMKAQSSIDASSCFSIVSNTRTVDFVCVDLLDRDVWVRGLKLILELDEIQSNSLYKTF